MTLVQWLGVIFLGVMFFGSFTLGRYMRRRDFRKEEERDREWREAHVHPIRPVTIADIGGSAEGYVYSAEDETKLCEFMSKYYAELDRLAWGYYKVALFEGEAKADQWLREQTGRGQTP